MNRSPTAPVQELAQAWRAATRPLRWRAALGTVAAVAVTTLLWARMGTMRARLLAAALAVAALVALALWRRASRRWASDPRRILAGPVAQVDPDRAGRALRALSLLPATRSSGASRAEGTSPERANTTSSAEFADATSPGRADGTSPELAALHIERTLAGLPSRIVVERASRGAGRWGRVALAFGLGALGVAFFNGWSLIEGADVLLARHGVAPVALGWLDSVEVVARPPEYLHVPEIHDPPANRIALPYGTSLVIRGMPTHASSGTGRLALTDGVTEAAFVEDGAGAVIARWSLAGDCTVRVVARFGDVVIPAPWSIDLVAVPDTAPIVRLQGAPRRLNLAGTEDDIPLVYDASDDHGMREVHLVLQSGTREERRVLARLDGETTTFQGGSVLSLRDPFLVKSHAPITVTVQARDNDPLKGPKWGSSEAITLVPPDVGEREARRLDALRVWRDALVDSLAWRMENGGARSPAERADVATQSKARAEADEKLLASTLGEAYGGVRVPSPLRALLSAQQQKAQRAFVADARRPTGPSHEAAVQATERFALVGDAVLRGLGMRDARAAAKELADVADDLALGASQMQNEAADVRARGTTRMETATMVLGAGGSAMRRLGALGRDLGEIVGADLARVRRARDERDLVHGELAARDLAARLRQPDPSFDSRGGGGGRGGGEAGGDPGTPGDDPQPPDDVAQAFEEAAQDLERLAQEHAGQMSKMEQALAAATDEEQTQDRRDEARRHAQAIREIARSLPAVGLGSESWTSKGSAARELAEQMAHSVEDGRAAQAVDSGRSALGALDEARRMLQKGGWFEDPRGDRQQLVEQLRRKLEGEQRWAEQQSADVGKRAAERARDALGRGGHEEEGLADRARALAERGKDSASFPEQAVESIGDAERAAREAARALEDGDAPRGLERQHMAQRALEAAREALQGEEESGRTGGGDGDASTASQDPVAIPNANEHKGPEEFRRRVMRGLSQPVNGGLREAVQRYAEGLLR